MAEENGEGPVRDDRTPDAQAGRKPAADATGGQPAREKVISLTGLGGPVGSTGPGGGGGTGDAGTPKTVEPYTLEQTRAKIAYILLAVLGAVIGVEVIGSAFFAIDCWAFGRCANAKDAYAIISAAMGTVFTAMIGLVGSVVGFYFGSQKQP